MDTTVTDRAGPREWVGLAVPALPLLVLALDVSVLYLAAPALAADLQPTATQQLWILDVYGFLIAGFLITMGTLGDRIGRRRLLLTGATAFAGASVLAALAPTAELLIVARALLGVAGATLMPSTLGLISTMFPDPAQRRFAVAVWMTTFSVGAALGPLLGGALVEAFWWGAIFLIGVPAMPLLVVLGPWLLPEERGSRAGRLDAMSVALSLAAMLPLVYTVKNLAAYGPDAGVLVTGALGAAAAALFVRRQRRLSDPLLDLALFTRPAFSAAVLVLLVSGTVLGLSPIGVLGTDLVIGAVPPARAGSAASISETAGELGVALGVAVTGSVLAAVYSGGLVLPPELPADVAGQAREGLAGAVTAAESLPEDTAAALLDAGRSAFTAGFGVVGLVGAGLLAGVVVLALTALRRTDG